MCAFAMIFAYYLEHCFKFSFELTIVVYVLTYYVFLWLVNAVNNAVFSLVFDTEKYIGARICLLLTLIFDIEENLLKWKVISSFAKGDYEKAKKYFDSKNYYVSYLALSIYAYNVDAKVVLDWFDNKYLKLKIQIPSEYEGLYRWLVKNSLSEE